MAFGQFLMGVPQRIEQVERFKPSGQNALEMLLKMGGNTLQNPYEGFDPIEKRARSQFNQQTIPSLAERFTSLGSNSLSSPSFASHLGQAGAGLEEGLAALRSDYGNQSRQHGLDLLRLGLTSPYESFGVDAQPGLAQPIAGAAGQGFGEYLGSKAGSGLDWLMSAILRKLGFPSK